MAKNGSIGAVATGTATNSATGAVVVIEALTGRTVVGAMGLSWAKQTIQVVARKTTVRMILIRHTTFLWIGELFVSGDLGNPQKGRERSELGSIHRELYHAQSGSPNLRVHVPSRQYRICRFAAGMNLPTIHNVLARQ